MAPSPPPQQQHVVVSCTLEARRHLGLRLEDGYVPLTKEEIHRAYLTAAMRYHPDRKHSNTGGATPCAIKFKICLQTKDLLLKQQFYIKWQKKNNDNFYRSRQNSNSSILSNGSFLRSNYAIRGGLMLFLTCGFGYVEWTRLQQQSQGKKQKQQQKRMAYRTLPPTKD